MRNKLSFVFIIIFFIFSTIFFISCYGIYGKRNVDVMYVVIGNVPSVSVTYLNSQGGTEQINNIKLNKNLEDIYQGTNVDIDFEGSKVLKGVVVAHYISFPSNEFPYLSAQNMHSSGGIVVDILVNNRLWKRSRSSGGYVIATASGNLAANIIEQTDDSETDIGYIEVPLKSNWINDYANIISDVKEEDLNRDINNFYTDYSIDIYILTIDSLDGLSIEDYALKIFDNWSISDNGMLFLISSSDREIRIEIGYEIIDLFSNAKCEDIIDKMTDYFSKGDFDSGIEKGINTVIEEAKS